MASHLLFLQEDETSWDQIQHFWSGTARYLPHHQTFPTLLGRTLFSYPHQPQTTNSRTQHTIWSSLSTSGMPVRLHLTIHLCDSTCSWSWQRCGRHTLSCWDQCPLEWNASCPRLWCHGNGPAGRPANPCTPVFSIILTPDTADASSTLWFIHTLRHLYWYTSPTGSTILETYRFRLPSLSFTSRNSSYSATPHISVCMARNQRRCT